MRFNYSYKPYSIYNQNEHSKIILLCDHASKIIPKKYKSMMSKLDKKDMVELDTQNTENKWGFSPMHTNREDFHKETFLTIVVETLFEDIGIL